MVLELLRSHEGAVKILLYKKREVQAQRQRLFCIIHLPMKAKIPPALAQGEARVPARAGLLPIFPSSKFLASQPIPPLKSN